MELFIWKRKRSLIFVYFIQKVFNFGINQNIILKPGLKTVLSTGTFVHTGNGNKKLLSNIAFVIT